VSRIVEIIRRVVLEELARNRGSLLGVVTTVYPHEAEDDENNYEANVRLKHEDLELRRVPIAVGHVGVAAPPRAGDLVLVQFLNGDSNQPLVTGRFYHADDRPPLHYENEIRFEQRLADGKLNHLRFTENGSILLQREVTKQEKNGNEAKASIKVDGESGDIEIKTGDKISILLKHDSEIQVTADGKPINIKSSKMTVTGDVEIKGDLKVLDTAGSSTTISGHEITGA
jgi:hypothetical protein